MGINLGTFFHTLDVVTDYIPVVSTGKGVSQLVSKIYHTAVDSSLKKPENCKLEHVWRPIRREGNIARSVFLCIPIVGNIVVGIFDKNSDKQLNLLPKDLKGFDEKKLKEAVEWGSGSAAFSLGKKASLPEEKLWWFKRGAELGNAESMNELGKIYAEVEKNAQQAAYWYTKAAKHGVVEAMHTIGRRYATGEGVKKDLRPAVYWYTKAVEKGYVPAMSSLGFCYEKGEGIQKDYKKAFDLFSQAIQGGDTEAACHIGLYYQGRKAFPEDLSKAVSYYTLAAEKGSFRAKYLLGYCFEKGLGVEKNVKKAVDLYEEAANKANDKEAMYRLGLCFQNEEELKDVQKAIAWHSKAIEKGNLQSKIHLGECYKEQGKLEQAIDWYKSAIHDGDVEAMYRLGKCFQEEEAVKNLEEAINWYSKAADNKHVEAAYALGNLCEKLGDLERAVNGYEKAFMYSEASPDPLGMRDLERIYQDKNTSVDLKKHILEFSQEGLQRLTKKHRWLYYFLLHPKI